MGEPVQTLCNQSSPIYGKAGRGLLFEAYFLEPKKCKKGGIHSSDYISRSTSSTLTYDYSSTAADFEH